MSRYNTSETISTRYRQATSIDRAEMVDTWNRYKGHEFHWFLIEWGKRVGLGLTFDPQRGIPGNELRKIINPRPKPLRVNK